MDNFLIIVALAGIGAAVYFMTKKAKKQENTYTTTDKDRYDMYKQDIERAIRDKDYKMLENMLNTKVSDFPDLHQMIKAALKNRA
ncbi:hypothetical protein DCO58_02915 [Helicobacter saguini]|uniref:Uncharacterized protein n=1 Tax=Helicobacter saguini TaxID=1548018 RepID=A0A347VS31_9HELI|nr:hypothetical protein [Helicobacter saguini]MWV62673.1 hypothetical protein [Helicobacter saguini]MWV66655.1 hypothetical protein [Helicobacter saguini]MWV69005.1 hypothetical protein [Helicobacter saguini]MWV71441.1 hypothetical protein [Helicobacter saguini]TLD94090.1 hypothetical protein LS64_007180 [Helicobacter saguini]